MGMQGNGISIYKKLYDEIDYTYIYQLFNWSCGEKPEYICMFYYRCHELFDKYIGVVEPEDVKMIWIKTH